MNEEFVGPRRISQSVVTGIFSPGPSGDAFIPAASFRIQRQQHVASLVHTGGLPWPRLRASLAGVALNVASGDDLAPETSTQVRV